MRNMLLTLAFDGTAYHGWQVQANALTVQQTLQEALERVLGSRPDVTGCSRTDAGVHARMFCCGLRTESRISGSRLVHALNACLPDDIAVYGCADVPDDFHARYDCVSKEYIYTIRNSSVRDPFDYKFSYRYKHKIDERLLQNEASAFLGTHDFKSFCAAGSAVKDTVRTVRSFTVKREEDHVLFTVEADGFLYNMVRIMVGTLIGIQQGKLGQESVAGIINAKDRSKAGVTVPAKGLSLNRVCYKGILP